MGGLQKALVATTSILSVIFGVATKDIQRGLMYSHLLSVAFGSLLFASAYFSGRRDAVVVLSGALLIVLGPLGAVATLALWCTAMVAGKRESEMAWLLEPEIDLLDPLRRTVHDRLMVMRAHSPHGKFVSDAPIVPFLDTIRFGSDPEKQVTLGQIGRNYSPAFAPALKAGLDDPAGLIRVQVGTTLAAIDERNRKSDQHTSANQDRVQKMLEQLSGKPAKASSPVVKQRSRKRFSTVRKPAPVVEKGTKLPTLLECRILVEDLIREKKFSEARKLLRSLLREESRRSEATQNLVCRYLFAMKEFAALRRYMAWVARPVSLASVMQPSGRQVAND